jgi:hypothetical protein
VSAISYRSLFINSFSSLLLVLKGCYVIIISLALIQTIYRTLLYYWFESVRAYLLLFFNVGIKPLTMLIMFGYILAFLKGKNITLRETLNLNRDYYIKFFIFYLILGFILFAFGGGVMFLVITIIFLRFPFVESMLYFENQNLVDVIKENYHNIPKTTLRFLMVLLCGFMLLRYGFYKLVSVHFQTNYLQIIVVVNELINAIFTYIYHAYMAILFLTLNDKVKKKHNMSLV